MKIGADDKIQALRRSEQYKNDFDAYLKERGDSVDVYVGSPVDCNIKLSKAGKKLCSKYNLFFPYDPVQPYSEDDSWYTSPIVTSLDHPRKWRTKRALGWYSSDEKRYTHINGKLVLMIDLDKTYSKGQTIEAVDAYLKRWKTDNKERTKGKPLDKWKIFDMKNNEGKNLLEITRKIYGFKKHSDNLPAYNDKVNKLHQRTVRAYRKAKAIITLIENPS